MGTDTGRLVAVYGERERQYRETLLVLRICSHAIYIYIHVYEEKEMQTSMWMHRCLCVCTGGEPVDRCGLSED